MTRAVTDTIPHIPLVTVQVRELDYRFHELVGLELRGQATGEEIAELNAMPNSNGQWL